MAEFGANYPVFKAEADSAGIVLGKLVTANLTVNLASGEMYADDSLAEQLSEFSSGSLAMETDDLTDDKAAKIYGCSVADGVVTYNAGDTAPRGSLGYYKVLMRNGVKYYKAYYYPRVRAALGNDNAQTRNNAITFQAVSTTFTIFADDDGDWRETKTFSTAEAAKGWLATKCSLGIYHAVAVSVQGAEGTDDVDKIGEFYVADGSDFVMNITGTVSKLYDNGTDKTASISTGVYTIASIAEDHTVAVIF